jgi:hypothetical protein
VFFKVANLNTIQGVVMKKRGLFFVAAALAASYLNCETLPGDTETEAIKDFVMISGGSEICGTDLKEVSGLSEYSAYQTEQAETQGDFGVYYAQAADENKQIELFHGDSLLTIRFNLKPASQTGESWVSIRKEFSASLLDLSSAKNIRLIIANNEKIIGAPIVLRLTLCTIDSLNNFGVHGADYFWWCNTGLVFSEKTDFDTVELPIASFLKPPFGAGIRQSPLSTINPEKIIAIEVNMLHTGSSAGSISIKEFGVSCSTSAFCQPETLYVQGPAGTTDTLIISDTLTIVNHDTITILDLEKPDSAGEVVFGPELGIIEAIDNYEELTEWGTGSLKQGGYMFYYGLKDTFSATVEKGAVRMNFAFKYSTFGDKNWIQARRTFKQPINVGYADGIFLKFKVIAPYKNVFTDMDRSLIDFVVYDYESAGDIQNINAQRRWKIPLDGKMMMAAAGKEFEIYIPFDALQPVEGNTFLAKSAVKVNRLNRKLISGFALQIICLSEDSVSAAFSDVRLYQIGKEESGAFPDTLIVVSEKTDTIFKPDTVIVIDSISQLDTIVTLDSIIVRDTVERKDTVVMNDTVIVRDTTIIIDSITIVKVVPLRVISTPGFVLTSLEGISEHETYSYGDSVDVIGDWGFYRTKYDTNTKADIVLTGDTMTINFNLPLSFSWGNWISLRWQSPAVLDMSANTGIEFDLKVETPSTPNITVLRNTVCDILNPEDYDIHAADYMWWHDQPALILFTASDWQTVRIPFASLYQPSGAGTRGRSAPPFNPSQISAFEINLVGYRAATSGKIKIANIRTY